MLYGELHWLDWRALHQTLTSSKLDYFQNVQSQKNAICISNILIFVFLSEHDEWAFMGLKSGRIEMVKRKQSFFYAKERNDECHKMMGDRISFI